MLKGGLCPGASQRQVEAPTPLAIEHSTRRNPEGGPQAAAPSSATHYFFGLDSGGTMPLFL